MDSITIGEDCALTSSDRSAGRRGLAGTVLLNKVKSILTCRAFDVNVYVEHLNSFPDMWCARRGREKFRRNREVWKTGYRKHGCNNVSVTFEKFFLV